MAYCAHRIHFDGEQHYSVWCRKAENHVSHDHTYWASGMHVKWTDAGTVVEASGAHVWQAGDTYRTEPR